MMETIEQRAEKYYQSLARPLADEKNLVITAYCVGAESERIKHILKNGGKHDGLECNYTMCYADNHLVKDKCLGWCELKK